MCCCSMKEIDTKPVKKKTVVGMGKHIRAYKKEIAAAMGAGTESATLYSADTVELIDRTALAQLRAQNGPGTPADNTSMRSFIGRKTNA
jgi:hypothetical protein